MLPSILIHVLHFKCPSTIEVMLIQVKIMGEGVMQNYSQIQYCSSAVRTPRSRLGKRDEMRITRT